MIYKRGCNSKGANGTCSKCGERGACGVYWYKFMWQGKLIRESTKQGNDKVARQVEAAHRTSLAKGEVGIREKKPVPILSDFIEERFEPWAKARFEKSSPKTWRDYYRVGLLAIKNYNPLASMKLDEITSETVADFAAYRQSSGLQVSTVNGPSPGRVLPAPLGITDLDKRSERDSSGHSRKDGCGAARLADDATGQECFRKPLGTRRKAAGRLGMACTDT